MNKIYYIIILNALVIFTLLLVKVKLAVVHLAISALIFRIICHKVYKPMFHIQNVNF